ncbi:MAG: hypothetical protein ABIH39_06635 [Candidatus Margulisiibacteriota bacterium]
MFNSFNWLRIILAAILLIGFLTGCASVVTTRDLAGNSLRVEIDTTGSLAVLARYYCVFAYDSEPQFPYVNLQPYLIGPGETYQQEIIDIGDSGGDIGYYYENYFNTWNDFVVLEGTSFFITQGPFPPTANETVHYSFQKAALTVNQAVIENKIVLYFDLSFLNKGHDIDRIYFNIFTTDASHYCKDMLDISGQINNTLGAIQTGTDPEDTSIDSTLDIRNWQVSIE